MNGADEKERAYEDVYDNLSGRRHSRVNAKIILWLNYIGEGNLLRNVKKWLLKTAL